MDVYQLMDLMFSVNFQVLSLVVTLLIVYIESTKSNRLTAWMRRLLL